MTHFPVCVLFIQHRTTTAKLNTIAYLLIQNYSTLIGIPHVFLYSAHNPIHSQSEHLEFFTPPLLTLLNPPMNFLNAETPNSTLLQFLMQKLQILLMQVDKTKPHLADQQNTLPQTLALI